MVAAERNMEEGRNGRRSRGASPNNNNNGHLSDDSSSDDSDSEGGMRIGDMYQAKIPNVIGNPAGDGKYDSKVDAILVWAPSSELTEFKIDEYTMVAKEKHGYNTEQALGMLFWHKHHVEKALADLPNFTPYPDDWTTEDKVLFEQAFSFHGKSFHRIRQMLPDKSISSLVKYYYSWKKTRSRTSLMDRQAKKLANQREDESDGGSEAGSGASDSDIEHPKDGKSDGKPRCSNCGVSASQLHATPKGSLCNSCYQYWRRTGLMRSNLGPKKQELSHSGRHNPIKHKRKPPRGIYLNKEDLIAMATGPSGQGDAILKQLEAEIISLKRQVRQNKQIVSQQAEICTKGVNEIRDGIETQKINPRWTNEELLIAVQGVRKYGNDFLAISEVIGNKSESHVRSFFINYRRRYNLDEVLAEYEAENGLTEETQEKEEEKSKDVEMKSAEPAPSTVTNSSVASTAAISTSSAAIPSTASSTVTVSAAPPPLLKQSPSIMAGGMRPPPLHPQQHQARFQNPNHHHHRTMLHQPPPLIRPNAVPHNNKSVSLQ
ncbi:REST corepressor 1-like [Tubulanus polymorphus]|uniref:REST corepressor 1-like n=1 Tax=Tubulanus polymorphus TaxID=672921 RepID=UPI003DA1DD15